MMNKTPILYRIGRTILGPIFKFYYHPQIRGKENLKTSGNKIIASNHIHLYDQCHTIISTSEFITFMAKKEYFDSKKTRWFFSSVGCIPVDRTHKDDLAVKSALEVLTNGGNVGIFPEGTRNGYKPEKITEVYKHFEDDITYQDFAKKVVLNKPSVVDFLINLDMEQRISKSSIIANLSNLEKYLKELLEDKIISEEEYFNSLLLDFKFGAVSMAQKTDSYLIPVAVTGSYKFRSKDLIINFGKPFKVTNMELNEANKLLRNNIINLMKENMKGR